MKKKIISATLAAFLVITSAMPAFATPNQEVIENQNKYDEFTKKIEEINNKIYSLNAEIEPLVATIEENNTQIEQRKPIAPIAILVYPLTFIALTSL